MATAGIRPASDRRGRRQFLYKSSNSHWWMEYTLWGCQGGELKRRVQTHFAVGTLVGGFYFTIAVRGFGRFVRLRLHPFPYRRWNGSLALPVELVWGRL